VIAVSENELRQLSGASISGESRARAGALAPTEANAEEKNDRSLCKYLIREEATMKHNWVLVE
jgi:hypothetical protein